LAKIKNTLRRNRLLEIGSYKYLSATNKTKILPTLDKTFNPETMERVPHSSGKGFVERLKQIK